MTLRVIQAFVRKISTYVESPYGIDPDKSGQAPGLHGLKDVLDQRSSAGTSSGSDFTKMQNERITSGSSDSELDEIYQQFLEKIKRQNKNGI